MSPLGSLSPLVHCRPSVPRWIRGGVAFLALWAPVEASATQAVLTCAPDTTIWTSAPLVRRFSFHNSGAVTNTYAYTAQCPWCTPVSGLVTLGPGEETRVDVSCNPPASPSCPYQATIEFSVSDSTLNKVLAKYCYSTIAYPNLSAVLSCPPDVTASAGESVTFVFCARNPNPFPRTYWLQTSDALGWLPIANQTSTIDPGDSVCVERTMVVPLVDPCTANQVYLASRLSCDPIPNNYESCSATIDITPPGPLQDASLVLSANPSDYNFGSRVIVPGDLNGDGFGDFAISSYITYYVSDAPGRVYVYFGGPQLDATPDMVLTEDRPDDQFGFSLTSLDLNADGSMDLAVGDRLGDVRVYFGGQAFDSTADILLHDPLEDLGASLAGGDVNGDGKDDLLLSAHPQADPWPWDGEVLVYFGGPLVGPVPGLTIPAPTPMNHFGSTLAAGGDVNGDGFGDFVVGAAGSANVFFGGPDVDATPDAVMPSAAGSWSWPGLGLGDVNSDGLADVLVGDPQLIPRVSIYFGSAAFDTIPDLVLVSASENSGFGETIAAGLDLDGDGHGDICVGSTDWDYGQGHVRFYRGGPALDATCDGVWIGEQSGQEFGCSLAMGPDVNGDESVDLVVGARLFTSSQTPGEYTGPGRAYLFPGGTAIDVMSHHLDVSTSSRIDAVYPAGREVRIRYRVGPSSEPATLEVFDVAGRRIRVIESVVRVPGLYGADWDRRDQRGHDVARGLYLVRLHTPTTVDSRKIVLR